MPTHFTRSLILFLAMLGFLGKGTAQTTDQNYPVTAQAFVQTGASTRLASYFASSRGITVNLVLKDLTKTSIQVYLRWSIDGPGVRVASMDGYIPARFIDLDRGMITRLSGQELQNDYFRQDIIEEQGLVGPALRASLPEGFYTFRVQALEASTGREVSNQAETYFSVTTPLPPIINIPLNGVTLSGVEGPLGYARDDARPIQIQWMPRHYKLPGHLTSYDLKVCKIPDGYEPQEAIDACVNPVIDDKANPGTFYPSNTGIGNSIIGAWEQGARYAVRVTVQESDTNGDPVLFANEGRSEVTWFRYGEPCTSPETFTIKEIGPGRVQLNWQAQKGTNSYNILWRPSGTDKWNTQLPSPGRRGAEGEAITATILGLKAEAYEFKVQNTACKEQPENTQTYTLGQDKEEKEDKLPPALTDPMQIVVQTSGCTAVSTQKLADYYSNFPGVETFSADTVGKLKIPACALIGSDYEGCDTEHPVIVPAASGTPLKTLKPGDVLGIYDMAAFVIEATEDPDGFSGKAFMRQPFMNGTMISSEFTGLKAWATAGADGGCVYAVTNFQSTFGTTDAELSAMKTSMLTAMARRKEPAAYVGTLADALQAYDTLPTGKPDSAGCAYKAAILQASGIIKDALEELDTDYPGIKGIQDQLKTITDSLKAGRVIKDITSQYKGIFARLDSLRKSVGPQPVLSALTNVQVSDLTTQSARISWEPAGSFTRYVIEYTGPTGGTLQETLAYPQVTLQRLLAGTTYTYRILGYQGDSLAATYGEGTFNTTAVQIVPRPENLTYEAYNQNGVKITWDKNKAHQRYKLVYIDQTGTERTLYLTTNSARISGLERDQKYAYRIVAIGEEGVESEVVNNEFRIGTVCELSIVSTTNRLVQGESVTLIAEGCYDEVGTPGQVEWKDENTGNFFGERSIVVSPRETTTYTADCILRSTQNNGGTDYSGCSRSITLLANKGCDGVVISSIPLEMEAGQQIVLKSTGCTGKPEWQQGYPSGKSLGQLNNVFVTVKDVGTYPFLFSCTDASGDRCFVKTANTTVKPNCSNFVLAASSYGSSSRWFGREIKVVSVGCEGWVDWSVDEKRGAKRTYPDNVLNHSVNFSAVNRGFTVNAECKANGCKATTGYINRPTGYSGCATKVTLRSETANFITLAVEKGIFGPDNWYWTDDGSRTNPRTFPKPENSKVYTVHALVGKSGCDASYAYEVKPQDYIPEIPCAEFKITAPAEVVILRDQSSKEVTVSAVGCTDGTVSKPVYWSKNGTMYETPATSQKVIFTKGDADAGKVTVSAKCTLSGVTIDVPVRVRMETVEEENCRKKKTDYFYAWVEPPVSSQGAFYQPKYGARAKVFVEGCEGIIRWESLKMKDGSIESGSQTSFSESQVWFTVPVMQTSFYYVTCNPKCGPSKVRLVVVPVKPTEEDSKNYPRIIYSQEDTKQYSSPNLNCEYYESTLTVTLGDFVPKSQENNRGGYNHIIERNEDNNQTRMILMAGYCYNGPDIQKKRGEPRWFRNAARTQLYENYDDGITIIEDIPKVTTTYYGRCFYAKDKYCDFDMTVNMPLKSGREPAIGKEGGVSIAQDEKAEERNCIYPTGKAVEMLLANILCNKLSLVSRTPRDKLEAVGAELEKRGITLGTVTDEIVKKYNEGKCEEVAAALVKDIAGNEKVDALTELVNPGSSNEISSKVLDPLADSELINTDFVTREIETFDGPVDPNGRVGAIGLCPDYYFTPAGKRIRIPDIGNCVVSINGVLMSFERNGKKYVPVFRRNTLVFVGYCEEADFYANATESIGTDVKVAPGEKITKWVANFEYPDENSRMGRFISFIEENKGKEGVVKNYTTENFEEVKAMLAQMPESIFEEVEGDGSVFLFDLVAIRMLLQKSLDDTDKQLATLHSILTKPETVCTAQQEAICKVYNCVYNQIKGYRSMDILNGRLPLEIRKKLLTLLAQHTLTSGTMPGGCAFAANGEATVLSLLRTTPENERKAVLDHLYASAINTVGTSPLKALISKVDGGNLDDLLLILSDWITSYYPSKEIWSEIIQREDRAKRALLLLGYGPLQTTLGVYSKDGKTTFDFSVQVTGTAPVLKPDIDALDYVVVKFHKDFSIGSQTFRKDEVAKIPAMLCYLIMNNMKNGALATAGRYTAYGAGFVIGATQIMAATTGVELTIAIIDMGMLATDFTMNEVLAQRLNQTQEGRTWLDNFNKFTLAYGGVRAVTELTGLAKELRSSGKVITNPNDILSNAEISEVATAVKSAELKAGIIPELVTIDIDKIYPLLKTELNTAFFWSGRTNGIGGADVALSIAKQKGGFTLEELIRVNDIKMPIYDTSVPSSVKAWEDVSAAYASQVSGEIRGVIGKELRSGNVWENTELPLLKLNTKVTRISIIDPVTYTETVIFKR